MSEHEENQTTSFTTFADWCRHKDSLAKEARQTVEVLLELTGTSDCDDANQILSTCTELNLSNKQISDISPLSSLTNLTNLNLRENYQISDFSPLSNLTNLTCLSINGNKLRDISPLSPLTNLTSLNIKGNKLRDISLLSNLTNLTRLDLRYSQVSDISPLSSLTNLTYLNLYGTEVRDISPLSNLTNLTSLSISGNGLRDISPLSSLTKLTGLILRGGQISDILPLSNLTNLTGLNLHANELRDISPLSNLTNLTSLNIYSKQINDISPLYPLSNLTSLHVRGGRISDISPQRPLLDKWRTLSTIPLEHQKAAAAVKVAYALIGQAEPEIIFFSSHHAVFSSSPDASLTSSAEYTTEVVHLTLKLCQAAMEGFSFGFWIFLLREMQFNFPECHAIKRQLKLHLLDSGLDPINYLTPENLVIAISVAEYCVSKFGYVLTHKAQQAFHCLNQLLEHCGSIFAFGKFCIVCERPIKFSLDIENRLHALGEPAIEFADGYKLYSYHGITLPEKYGKLHPNKWQSQWLLEEENAEHRRVLIQVIGYDRICQELQATEIDAWQEYTLLKIDNNVDIEPIHLLKMTCPSTGFIHALRVPPDVNSARDAIYWVNWGTDPEEFSIQT